MKRNLIIGAIALLTLVSCKKEVCILPNNPENSKLFPDNAKILLLGDSRVEGGRPDYESYRYELWKNLIDTDWSFDFIGPEQDPSSYEEYSAQFFDPDHMGYGGITTKGIYPEVKNKLSDELVPNIVLFCIGGNDLLGEKSIDKAVKNINKTIDHIQKCNPSVIIFIEQIAPGKPEIMTDEFKAAIAEFNIQISTIASEQTTITSHVIPVDMNTGWSEEYMADDVHYNEEGAKVIADRYLAAMEAFFEN